MNSELGIWEIAVLALLREAPMHPYQMQRLLRVRHKDELLALKKGSLYHAIGRLMKAELIAIEATGRNGRRPERTTYRLTEAGREALVESLRKMIAVPRRESSEFIAAMSFLVFLPVEEAVTHLDARCSELKAQINGHKTGLAGAAAHVPRIHLIETEYLVAMLKAELAWVREMEADLHAGNLSWDLEQIIREVDVDRERAAGGGADK
jgi:DNA-binding PadR family transcriptional regulator